MAKEKTEKKETHNLAELISLIDGQFGSGSIIMGRNSVIDVEVFSSGVASLDIALGVGGIPRGRIIELFGAESSGKTTTCLQIIANCQKHHFTDRKRNGVTAFIDAEHAIDPSWADKIGVDLDKLLISQPTTGEEAIQIVEMMADSKLIDLVVVDSVAALVPKSMLDGEIGDSNTMAALAQLMSRAMSRLKTKCHRSKTTVIFINQIRNKVGLVFGAPEVTPGGRALKFYATTRIEIKKKTVLKDGEIAIGHDIEAKIIKNKVAPPATMAEFEIYYGTESMPVCGIDSIGSLFQVALDNKIITKKGNFFNFGEESLGNGPKNAKECMRGNSPATLGLVSKIKEQVYADAASKVTKRPESEEDVEFFEESSDADDEPV